MKRILTVVATMTMLVGPAFAEETAGEKVDQTVEKTKSGTKKAANRTAEAFCTGTKEECEKQKAKHHAQETKDSASDHAKELKDKVD